MGRKETRGGDTINKGKGYKEQREGGQETRERRDLVPALQKHASCSSL